MSVGLVLLPNCGAKSLECPSVEADASVSKGAGGVEEEACACRRLLARRRLMLAVVLVALLLTARLCCCASAAYTGSCFGSLSKVRLQAQGLHTHTHGYDVH